MLLEGVCGISGQAGFEEEIDPNHADSYTDNCQSPKKHL